MKRRCQRCRTRLSLSKLKCRYCHEPAVSWLHLLAVAVFAVPVIMFLLRVIH